MAAGRTFETLFKIAAAFTGGAAFNQATNAIKGVEKQSFLAGISLKKMAMGFATFALGYKGITTATDFIKESIDSAREAKNSYDKLYTSLQRVPQLQKLGAAVTKEQTQRLYELSEQMQKAGGISSKRLAEGFAGLSKFYSPKKIYEMSAGFQDYIVKLKGVAPSAEEVSDIMGKLGKAITYGTTRPLMESKIATQAQIAEFKKIKDPIARANYVYKLISKTTGETARQMQTSKGIIETNRLAWEKLKETIGAPFIATQDRFAQSQTKLAKALQPVAERIADSMIPLFNLLANTIDANMPTIVGWIDKFIATLTKINWKEVSKWIAAVAAAFVAFKVIQGAVQGLNTFVGVWKLLSTLMSSGPALFAALTNPITLTILGIAALAAAIYLLITYWPQVSAAAVTAWNWIVQTWGQAGAWFAGLWEQIKASTEGVWGPLVEPLTRLYTELKPLLDPVVAGVQSLGAAFADSFADVPGQINEVIDLWQHLQSFFTGTILPGLDVVFAAWRDASAWVSSNVIVPIVNSFTDLIAKIKVGDIWGALQGWTSAQEQIAANVIAPILTLFGGLAGQISAELGGIASAIAAPFIQAYNEIMGLFGNIATAISGTLSAITGAKAAAGDFVAGGGSGKNTPTTGATGSYQLGGLVSSPTIGALAERGVPEMVIPMEGTGRSRGLLSSAASAIGMGSASRGGGTANISLSMSAPITINGAAAGQEGAIGREVERALQDPIRSLLEQLKKARSEEQRLSYA